MEKLLKNYKFSIGIGTMVSIISFIGLCTWNSAFSIADAEEEINQKIAENSSKIELIENKFENQQNYLYNFKSDIRAEISELKEDIKNNDEKLDKIYNFLIK